MQSSNFGTHPILNGFCLRLEPVRLVGERNFSENRQKPVSQRYSLFISSCEIFTHKIIFCLVNYSEIRSHTLQSSVAAASIMIQKEGAVQPSGI